MTDICKVIVEYPNDSIEEKEIGPSEYVLVTGPHLYLDGIQQYGNGTIVLTIKREKGEA